jgi:hypothetical protein
MIAHTHTHTHKHTHTHMHTMCDGSKLGPDTSYMTVLHITSSMYTIHAAQYIHINVYILYITSCMIALHITVSVCTAILYTAQCTMMPCNPVQCMGDKQGGAQRRSGDGAAAVAGAEARRRLAALPRRRRPLSRSSTAPAVSVTVTPP